QRFFARLIDGMIIGVLIVFLLSFTVVYDFVKEPRANFIFNLFMLLIVTVYMIALPVIWYGWSIGKRLLGIRITHVNGQDVTWQMMLKRELFILVVYSLRFGVFFLLAGIKIGISED